MNPATVTERMTVQQYKAQLAGASGQRIEHEYDEQVRFFAVVEWLAARNLDHAEELEDVYATSSGGLRDRATAGRMKEAGQRRGVPDIEVWVPRGPWHGLVIELKPVGRGSASPEQAARLKRLAGRGYRAVLHHGWIPALAELCNYLGLAMPTDPEGIAAMVLWERTQARRAERSRKRQP